MRKMLIIIGILFVIFISMIIVRNTKVQNNESNNVSIEEIEQIEQKISSVYLWREITEEALPTFDNINNANDKWIWEVVKNNLENYEVTYEEIQEEAKIIFGENFNKELPHEGNSSFEYNKETNRYIATEVEFDQEEDSFLLDNINKTDDGYIVEIVEYLEDYSTEDNVIVKTTNNEEIGRVAISESETKIQEIVTKDAGKVLTYSIIILVIWCAARLINSIASIIKYGSFTNVFSNIWSIVLAIITPLVGILVMSIIVYAMNKENKKSLLTIMTAITVASIPSVISSVISLLTIISSGISVITFAISGFCSVIEIILMYFAIKAIFGTEKNSEFIKTFVKVYGIFYIVAIIVGLLGINI